MTTMVRDLTSTNWDQEVLSVEGTVLVDFWAPWCPSCRTLASTIEKLADGFAGRVTLGKLNVDENPLVAELYGIRSLPTVIVFQRGLPVVRQVGALPEARLALLLELARTKTTADPRGDSAASTRSA